MPRSLWSGSISFGLVNIPVKMYTATSSKRVQFNQLHQECGSRIQYKKWCPSCEREVQQGEIVKGFQYEKDRYVVVDEDDLERLPLPSRKVVEILDFVELDEVDPVYYDKSYYLEPAAGASKAYHLLQEAMAESERAAVAKVALRSKESLALIRQYQEQALVLETMYYPAEVRAASELNLEEAPEVSERELQMAQQLIDQLASHFDAGKYTDNYRQALMQVIENKIDEQVVVEPDSPQRGQVIDLMAALQQSIEATREAREQDEQSVSEPAHVR